MVAIAFKAIELDSNTRQRTGVEHALAVETRQAAVDELLRLLGVAREDARIDPSRTLVQVPSGLWTIVGTGATAPATVSSKLRRAGAKHQHIR